MNNKTKLLPCPFCGSKAERYTLTDDANAGGDVISCTKCDACTRVVFGEKEGLVDAWNARAAPAKDVRAGNTASRIRAAVIADAQQEGVNIAEGRFGKALAALCVSIDSENVRAVVEEPVYRCHKCGCQTSPPAPYKLYVSCGCGATTAATAALCRYTQRPVVLPERLREVWLFLDGQAELNGCVFGEKPEGRHNFWWRKELRAVLEDLYPAQ